MPTNNIHPTAIVEPGAVIGNDVVIEPYAVVKKGVTLHDGVVIKSHAYIDGETTIGEGTVIFPSASIGTKPQHLKFSGEGTRVVIGKRCEIREFVTINTSSEEGSEVRIGDDCFIMAYGHIAHNCVLGNKVIMSNGVTFGGHVIVEDNVLFGGLTAVHQFVRIGAYAMIGGMSRVTYDIPPYTIGAGIPYKFGGLNLIGLKRHGFGLEKRRLLSKAFRLMYRSGLRLEEALQKIEQQVEMIPEIQHWICFCKGSKRGLMGIQGVVAGGQSSATSLEDYTPNYDAALKEHQFV